MKHADLGTISHATLKTEDLLSAFISELERQILRNGDYFSKPENFEERDRLNAIVGEAQDLFSDEGEMVENEEQASEFLNETLFDVLGEFSPPYCYFGANQGDGSDFGYWPDIEQIEELPIVEGSDEAKELGGDCKSVNDHGNVTVYGRNGEILIELV